MALFKKKVMLDVVINFDDIRKFVMFLGVAGHPSIKLETYSSTQMKAEIEFRNETEKQLFKMLLLDGKVGDILK